MLKHTLGQFNHNILELFKYQNKIIFSINTQAGISIAKHKIDVYLSVFKCRKTKVRFSNNYISKIIFMFHIEVRNLYSRINFHYLYILFPCR